MILIVLYKQFLRYEVHDTPCDPWLMAKLNLIFLQCNVKGHDLIERHIKPEDVNMVQSSKRISKLEPWNRRKRR